nr:JAB domain-containing protein [Treponema socranskii]
MNFEIFDNIDFNNKNLRFSEIPNQQQRTYLKQNGYSFTSRYGGVWYPRTYEAKKNNKEFVKLFAEKFYPSIGTDKSDIVEEKIYKQEAQESRRNAKKNNFEAFYEFYEEINKKPYVDLGRYMATESDLRDYEKRQDVKSWDNSELADLQAYTRRQISIGDDSWQPSFLHYLIQNEFARRMETKIYSAPPSANKETQERKDDNLKKQLSSLYTDPTSLFYEAPNDTSNVLVKSAKKDYNRSFIDGHSVSEKQITEAEQTRDRIIFPILNGKETGMYKAFKDFAEHGIFDIIGKSIELTKTNRVSAAGWKQLQAAMQIYRCKQFETLRYVLIDRHTGEITDQMSVSSHMPTVTIATTPKNNTLEQVILRAEEKDSLVIAVHNHPSGNIEASFADIEFTNCLEESCKRNDGLNRFAGHIILDHDLFNLYTPGKGWQAYSPDNSNTIDELNNQNFMFKKILIDTSKQLSVVAKKINDTNNWSDNFIPVVFTDGNNTVSGVKLYDKSFFNNNPQRIRNEFQYSGFEAGAIRAFPVITKNFAETMSVVDNMLFEDKLKNLVQNHAFADAALPNMTVTEKYNIEPGRQFFDTCDARTKEPEINATWHTKINPDLFSVMEVANGRQRSPVLAR